MIPTPDPGTPLDRLDAMEWENPGIGIYVFDSETVLVVDPGGLEPMRELFCLSRNHLRALIDVARAAAEFWAAEVVDGCDATARLGAALHPLLTTEGSDADIVARAALAEAPYADIPGAGQRGC